MGMAVDRRVRRRGRNGIWFGCARARGNAARPLSCACGRPFIPRGWRPRDEAYEAVRTRELLRAFRDVEARVNVYDNFR